MRFYKWAWCIYVNHFHPDFLKRLRKLSHKPMSLHTQNRHYGSKGATQMLHGAHCVPINQNIRRQNTNESRSGFTTKVIVKYQLISSSARRIRRSLISSSPQFEIMLANIWAAFPSVFRSSLIVAHAKRDLYVATNPKRPARLQNGGGSYLTPFCLLWEVADTFMKTGKR